jgi:hypothetical protein
MKASLSYSCENWSLILLVSPARVQTELKKQNLKTTSHEPPGKFPLAKAGVQVETSPLKWDFRKSGGSPMLRMRMIRPRMTTPMTRLRLLNWALVLLFSLGMSSLVAPTLLAQTAPVRVAPTLRPHQQPCWQQAGISQSAMQQRRQIERTTHAQVQSVCADSSLSPQQKHEKIRQLHEQTRQQVEGLISPAQQQALRACQQERSAAHGGHIGGGHHGGGGSGPCGELASGKGSAPQPEAEPEHEPEQK